MKKAVMELTVWGVISCAAACGVDEKATVNEVEREPPQLPAEWSLSHDRLDFGEAAIGDDEPTATVTLTNVGAGSSERLDSDFGGLHADQFRLVEAPCGSKRLDPEEACDITVAMRTRDSGELSGSLILTAGPGTVGVVRLEGVVNTTDPDLLSVWPETLEFEEVEVGTQSRELIMRVSREVMVGADGPPTAEIGGNGVDHFTIVRNGCAVGGFGVTNECEVRIAFTPKSPGGKVATLDVALGEASVSGQLRGTGVEPTQPQPDPDPAQLSISPDVQVFTMGTPQTFTVTNVGDEESGLISVGLAGPNFSQFDIRNNGCVGRLAGSEQCEIAVDFVPTAVGQMNATLDVQAMPGGMVSASLEGQ